MKLTDKEQEMLAGKAGPAVKWAMEHQLQVGRMFDAEDMVTVSQAHMMADPNHLVNPVCNSLRKWQKMAHVFAYR